MYTMKTNYGFFLWLAAVALMFGVLFMPGCDHGGDVPYAVPFCNTTDVVVTACPGYPTMDTYDGQHVTQVLCADTNTTMSCQLDTVKTYAYAACSRCEAAWRTVDVRVVSEAALAAAGVALCSPMAYTQGQYCATCDPAVSMQYAYAPASSGGFASNVVCVRDCAACTVEPQP